MLSFAGPQCASPRALRAATIDGSKAHPTFRNGTHSGTPYGILVLPAPAAAADPDHVRRGKQQRRSLLRTHAARPGKAGGRDSAQGSSSPSTQAAPLPSAATATNDAYTDPKSGSSTMAICFKLKRQGPCSSVAALCPGGTCVLAVVDRARECCPKLPLSII